MDANFNNYCRIKSYQGNILKTVVLKITSKKSRAIAASINGRNRSLYFRDVVTSIFDFFALVRACRRQEPGLSFITDTKQG